jgi:hypothetical protein
MFSHGGVMLKKYLLVFLVFFLYACDQIPEVTSFEVTYNNGDRIIVNEAVWEDFTGTIILEDGTYLEFIIYETLLNPEDINKLNIVGNHTIRLTYVGYETSFNIEVVYSQLTLQLRSIYQTALEADAFTGTYEAWLESVRGPQGKDGREVLFQVVDGYIKWQYTGDSTWTNLVSLSTLTGSDGVDGTNGTNGVDGRDVLFQVAEGYIQWQYTGDSTWTNLVSLSTLTGSDGVDGTNETNGVDGREVLFQVVDGYIQWQYTGDTTWTNLVSLSTLTGSDGVDGTNGTNGVDGLTPYIGENGNWYIGETDTGVFAGYRNDEIIQTGEYIFAVNSDGQSYYLKSYSGSDRFVSIPDYYYGYPVTAIGQGAFINNSIIESISISKFIKFIEDSAFKGTTNLTMVDFRHDSQLIDIGTNAFYGSTSLVSITIPKSVLSIGSSAFFNNNSLKDIIFEEESQIMNIGENAFFNTYSLVSIEIPNSVTTIGYSAFKGSYNLIRLTLPFVGKTRISQGYESNFGYIFGTNAYAYSYLAFGDYYLPKSLEEIIITDMTYIPDSAFRYASSITSIIIPESVTAINAYAFQGTNLTSFEIPKNVISIGGYAFHDSGLTSIIIPNNVTTIQRYAFLGLSLIYVEVLSIPSGWSTEWINKSYTSVIWGYSEE